MAENMGKWSPGHGQLTKIRLSEGDEEKSITEAARFGYNRLGSERYLGNVGCAIWGNWRGEIVAIHFEL